tara:strand:+ start:2332 stop:2601 length:270 start_codon:yes stop_codon:yes gene_type:complete
MTLFFKVSDNLGHLILNYLGYEDLYNIICNKYTNTILVKTKTPDYRYLLKNHWEDQYQAELYLKSDKIYQKYLNSEEFYDEMKEYIDDK